MFKLIYFTVLIFTFLISTAYSVVKFNSLNEKLVLNLIKVKPKTNVVGSELLVRFPLCKLASVATGETKQELMAILGYKDENALKSCYTRVKGTLKKMTEGDLTLANKIFVNYSNEIDPMFLINSTEKFGVQVEKVGFDYPNAAITFINNVFGAVTFKRITDIVDANDINKDTKMVIVTGAHFKGTWEYPFDYRLTKLTKFYHLEGKISRIPMMTKTDSFAYISAADCKAINIKFGSWKASITYVVPNTVQEFPKLLEKISDAKVYVNSLVKHMKFTPMTVILPRFKIKTFVDWSGFLKGLGLYSVFNTNSSDLAGILKKESKDKHIPLSKIKQKVFIQIDEMGVARFPIDDDNYNPGPPKMSKSIDLPKFIADKPFYFEITWDFENARYDLFAGVYYGPEPGALNI